MGLFTLLFALGATISETIRESVENHHAIKEQCRYEDIDWGNIESVTLDGTETAYRIEEEEEFDIVSTNFLTQQDGWQHYETKTVEYEVEDGENYCFTIRYKNGTEIYRKFHETSWLTQRLLEYYNNKNSDKILGGLFDVLDSVNDTVTKFEKSVGSQLANAGYASKNTFEENALKTAKSYLNGDGFSYTALIGLLEYEKFTPEQAKYGVDNSGADWNEQAAKRAKSYLKSFDYSRQRLIEQLKYEGFTDEQAEYGANSVGCTMSSSAVKTEQPKEHFAVIDFETTGLNYNFRSSPMDEIISVAIIDQDENVLLDTYCDTVNKKFWYEAERVHGISPRDVKGYPTFVEIMPKVIEILSSYDYVISYNVPFERSFLENYAHLYTPTDFSVYKIKWGEDPMEMFMDYMNSSRFLKLETAAQHFGYTYKVHDALEDTKAALYVYKALSGK